MGLRRWLTQCLYKHEDLSSALRICVKIRILNPSTEEKQTEPCSKLVQHSSLISDLQVSERLCLKQQGGEEVKKEGQGHSLVSTHICIYVHICTYSQEHVYIPTNMHT